MAWPLRTVKDWMACGVVAACVAGGGCGEGGREPASAESATRVPTGVSASAREVVVHRPTGPPVIETGLRDEHGEAVVVACAVCHSTKPVHASARIGEPLVHFHQGLRGPHGKLTCISCHNPEDGYESLRLADGRRIEYADVMTLCAQCHGPQYRDYQHGAHGGMTGYWDLSKGGRVRNNCIACHDPHAPAYPQVQPVPGPADRFLEGGDHE